MEPEAEERFSGPGAGAYGGSRLTGPRPAPPPGLAFDGRGAPFTHAALTGEMAPEDHRVIDAIAAQTDWMAGVLADLVRAPTVLGNEEPGQAVMRDALRQLDLEPVDVPMDADAIRAHPGHSPFDWDVDGKANVVATWAPGAANHGRSLILNGHIDVVSPEPTERWEGDPFSGAVGADWLYGRGAGDMKCGLAAILGAVRGLRSLGLTPHAPVQIQSVVEEECTGNGALQLVLAGHTADAAVIAEPFWFQVRIAGVAGHAAELGHAVNAIERSLQTIQALRVVEAELNAAPPPPYDRFDHPINMNVGAIHGGDWASTVPGECVTHYRIALYPGLRVRDLQDRIEAVVADAAAADPAPLANPPEVVYRGFACEGYDIPDDDPLVVTLANAFARQAGGTPPALVATTGTTDARVFGLWGATPSVCFGPYAEQAHGVDERVYLPSVAQTAQVMGLLIRDWCGLSG
jgi:acetylornithine deacetylase